MGSKKRTKEQMLAESLAKRHGRGFKRSRKEWENSVADHIGKLIDRVNVQTMIPYIFAAYAGFKAVPDRITVTREDGTIENIPTPLESKLMGAGVGTLALKLAMAPNLIAGGSGVAALAAIGLMNLPQKYLEDLYGASLPSYPDWWPFKSPKGWPKFKIG